MKKYFLLAVLSLVISKYAAAQVLCIYCYDQNDTISAGVNNLIMNGGFENNNCIPYPGNGRFCPNSSAYNCDIDNWTCTGGGIDTYTSIFDTAANSFSIIAEKIEAAYFGNDFCFPCSLVPNDTSCIINTGCTVTGIPLGFPLNYPNYGGGTGVSLNQTVNGLIPGNIYVLEFWAGGEYYLNWYQAKGLFSVDVGFGDTLLRNKPTSHSGGIGTRYIIEFNATSSSHTIKFTNWGHICQGCSELVLDDVRLYTLAELDASVPHCSVGISPTPALPEGEGVIYPNPANDEFTVSGIEFPVEITMYNVLGKEVYYSPLTPKGGTEVKVPFGDLGAGIYLYEIKNKEGVIKKGKVVKE